MDKNNKVNTNYFSDEDNDENDEDNNEDVDSDDSMDIETRQIVYESINRNRNINYNEVTYKTNQEIEVEKKVLSSTNKPIKNKNIFSLNEFIQKVNIDEKAKEPKKFVSKRMEEKKKQFGINKEIKPKRSFNPRIPPYNFVHGKKEIQQFINFSNDQEFPSLRNL
jgi:hypothetical protein